MRHDGTSVATAQEKYLTTFNNQKEEDLLGSVGMRRWKLQKCLYDSCIAAGITINLGCRVEKVVNLSDGTVAVTLSDKTETVVDYVFGCDVHPLLFYPHTKLSFG